MRLLLNLESIGFILRSFPLKTYSAILRIDILDPFINLKSELLANSLSFISILSSFFTVVILPILFIHLFFLSLPFPFLFLLCLLLILFLFHVRLLLFYFILFYLLFLVFLFLLLFFVFPVFLVHQLHSKTFFLSIVVFTFLNFDFISPSALVSSNISVSILFTNWFLLLC